MFHLVDYGDELRVTNQTKKLAGCGDDTESNQCTILSLAAGLESILQKVPLRAPNSTRVEEIARTIRETEAGLATEAYASTLKPGTQAELEVRSIAHNAINMHHCRDLRTLHLFLMPAVWQFSDVRVVVLEVDDSGMIHAHVLSKEGQISPVMMFMVAYKGHMRWGKSTSYSPPAAWRDWEKAFDVATWHLSVSWGEFLGANRAPVETLQLIPCRQCKAKVKTILSESIVGMAGNVDRLEGCSAELGAGPSVLQTTPGSLPMGDTVLTEGVSPIRFKEWRLKEVGPLAVRYLETADCAFSLGTCILYWWRGLTWSSR